MAHIRKLPSGKWGVRIRHVGAKSRNKSFSTKLEAEQWIRAEEPAVIEEAIAARNHIPTWLDMALLYCERNLMGRPSQKLTINRIERIARFERMNKPFESITIKDVNAYKNHRLKKASPTTCRDELMIIKRVYRWADREARSEGLEGIPNPCEFVTIPKPGKSSDKVIRPDLPPRISLV